jgi:microsomal dipeptidase-like Zn-dependent dipeptidase
MPARSSSTGALFSCAATGIDHIGIGTDYVVEPNGYPQWMKDYLASDADVQKVPGGNFPRVFQKVWRTS